METHCSGQRFLFQGPGGREIVAAFNGGEISSDGGLVLLQEVDRRRRLVERFAECFEPSLQLGKPPSAAIQSRARQPSRSHNPRPRPGNQKNHSIKNR